MAKKKSGGKLRWVLLVVLVALAAWGIRGAFLLGPEAAITLVTDREAVGPGTEVQAEISEPRFGIVEARIEAVQGSCSSVLAKVTSDVSPSPFNPLAEPANESVRLLARVGRGEPKCLTEGEVTLRVVATRVRGPLRRAAETVSEKVLPVVFRPPTIQVLSSPNYVRQGGSGAVAFRVSDSAVRAGVRVGEHDLRAFPASSGVKGVHFALYGVPFDHGSDRDLRLFAEDEAGNRAEASFVDRFKARPPRRDRIGLGDAFLERVVPAIVAQTPELDGSGSLLEQYQRINGELRVHNRAKIAELSSESGPERLWDGRFLQMANSARKAGYGETRDYTYKGRRVDVQTHLGIDLASVARAPVEAPNHGRVLFADFLGIYGNCLVIDHGQGLVSVLAHLSRIDAAPGQIVEKGEIVGRSGRTGLAGGDHLHLGLFIQGVAVDPIEWFDSTWIRNRIDATLAGYESSAN